MKELEKHGYLTRYRIRYKNGQLGDVEYTIHERPLDYNERENSLVRKIQYR